MVTKLLKKVRKRFIIIRVDELPTNPTRSQKVDAGWGLPYYQTIDTFAFGLGDKISTNEVEAYNQLMNMIRRIWKHKIKPSKGKTTKIWYN